MGCGESKAVQHSKKIEDEIAKDEITQKTHIRLLLLGAGESGKSTLAKQMKIIHLNGFTESERLELKPIIFNNIIGSMRVLIEESKKYSVPVKNTSIAEKVMEENYFDGELTPEIGKDIETLWSDPGIQETFIHKSDFQLNDSAPYYFQAIGRISSKGYIPTVEDVLRSRAKTTGIIETHFEAGNAKFTLVDVGGQRSERRKWMHCFQDVTAVIFVAAMSEYDQKLYEDENTNRTHEALKLFRDICNTKWFADTAIILFLNKKDLFAEKIQKIPLTVCFPEYKGSNKYEEASRYLEEQFLAQNENAKKLIYVQHTCATDTNNITVVFKAVQDIILTNILDKNKA